MKGAIASVEVYAARDGEPIERLTLTVTAPERARQGESAEEVWVCRVALARRHRPRILEAPDSVAALVAALELGRGWLAGLTEEGFALWRDRALTRRFEL